MTVETRFGAMGTEVWGRVADRSAARRLRSWFGDVEATASRFEPDSALTRLNTDHREAVLVPPVLGEILAVAADLRYRTGGLVDPAVGAAVAAWGYDRSFERIVPPGREPAPALVQPWSITDSVVSRAPGTVLDLGGVAKGWTCDRAVEMGLASVVSAGGDLRSADESLVVDVEHPEGGVAVSIRVGAGALATSSTARRRWQVGTVPVHHIVDPRTGRPASSPVVTASVVAATASEAEAGAKAVLLLGAEGLAWADDQPWIRCAVVCWDDGSVYAAGDLEVAA